MDNSRFLAWDLHIGIAVPQTRKLSFVMLRLLCDAYKVRIRIKGSPQPILLHLSTKYRN
jgi:hypothetical protein